MVQYVYPFADGKSEGNSSMKPLLGGKGAGLCEMTSWGLPIPAGFVISTECCQLHIDTNGQYNDSMRAEVMKGIEAVEKARGLKFGALDNPLLLSVRSGAAVSMPGMMDTVLNLGLRDDVVENWAKKGNDKFIWDSYRRFIAMYSNVVGQLDMEPFEHALQNIKDDMDKKSPKADGSKHTDQDIPVSSLKSLVKEYKTFFQKQTGKTFPSDPQEQLWSAIKAVFGSWNNARAIKYREMNNLRGLIGTAVTVQSMVYGNYDQNSATGVAFSRDPSTGENAFYGEYLINAQGEDVVAGIRTPQQITIQGSRTWATRMGIAEKDRATKFPSMEESMPACFHEFVRIKDDLEKRYTDMQDMEFTIQEGKFYFLQSRSGKRTALAAARTAVDMVNEGLITKEEAIMRQDPTQTSQLLLPSFVPGASRKVLTKGLPASPGAAVGQVVFSAPDAEAAAKQGKKAIMVRLETSPEDLVGMAAAQGILTARGGMTSHAAVVARGMGKCCICGVSDLEVKTGEVVVGGKVFKEGDWISLDGTTGEVLDGQMQTQDAQVSGGPFAQVLEWAKEFKRLGVRTNADTPKDCAKALEFGADGIGLCRTEHMFFEGNRIDAVREMMLAETEADRKEGLKKILPFQRDDFAGLLRALQSRPCTIRLLDPPMHEFMPHDQSAIKDLAPKIGKDAKWITDRVESLAESNPMLGLRGVRLGILYPEIFETQVQALFEAACDVAAENKGVTFHPEVMIPLVGKVKELTLMKERTIAVADAILKSRGITNVEYTVGTMIEVPRAALTADEIATQADFFSFGTNDLTQMACGFSRDDSGCS
jgi:pyruvate,orthophosphate dikinase